MELIYSVKEIFSKYLNGNEKFIIPAYQRGYKWKTQDIKQLLCDINAFQTHGDGDVFYCLQNITLVRNGVNFNVVDGQQRLTTLSLLLSFLGENELVKGKLDYQIRKESQAFLDEYVFSKNLSKFKNNQATSNLELLDWDDLCICENDDYNYQDIFYMYNAYRTMQLWFKEHEEVKDEMKEKILNRVKLIVNLPQINSSQELELFDNLNGKRVSLDGADLIRAMIITRVARIENEDIEDTIKHDVMLNENRVKNGLKLDEINRWWGHRNRQNYYRTFVKNINSKGENIVFDENNYPIDMLYKLYVQTTNAQDYLSIDKEIGKYSRGTIKLQYFENADNFAEFFAQLQSLQRLVEYWFNDDELYHLVLYSSIHLHLTFSSLVDLWYGNNKNSFIKELKKKIRDSEVVKLALGENEDTENSLSEEQKNFSENWYDGDNTNMVPIMVLCDIIRILRSKESKFPIANLDPSHFVAVKEDKEHIFPQTPLETGFDEETVMYYIEVAGKCGYPDDKKEHLLKIFEKYKGQLLESEGFRCKFNKKLTTEIVPINSLGNVCLLQDRVNRSYGNDFFSQKHFDIVQKSSNGEYISPHVLDAFTKVMAKPEQRCDFAYMQQWTKEDIFKRRQYIVSQLKEYLNK